MISSTGGAGQHVGGVLGQYEYYEDKGYYLQTSTEQNNGGFQAVYIYPDTDDNWWVGPTPGKIWIGTTCTTLDLARTCPLEAGSIGMGSPTKMT